jgi:putative peptidoglycan lipid II flippase
MSGAPVDDITNVELPVAAPPPTSGLLRNNIIVATGTAFSRLTGLLRVMVFAKIIGQTALADAYNSANSSPNAVYELLLGGVLSATLIPLFAKQAEDRDDEATSAVITVSIVAVTTLTVAAVIAAPLIFHIFAIRVAGGAAAAALYRDVGTTLARVFLIQIFFYGITALGTSLLNAHRRFFAAAWAPVLSNLAIIVSLLIIPHVVDGQPELGDVLTNSQLKWTLALGATIGIAVMALALIPAIKRTDVRLRWNWDLRHPAVRTLTKLSTWTLGYVVCNQIAVITMVNLADPGTGLPDAYAKAYILFVLPHGLLAMSIATTFEPEMARRVKRRDKAGFIDRTSLGIRLVALLTFPAGMLMFTLRRPIVGVALQHGEFTAANALATSRALGGFAIGLVGFSVYLFTLRGFYAHGDARTPFVINLFENVINIVLGVALHGRFGVLGLGLSFGIAYLISALWAITVLGDKVPGFPVGAVLRAIARIGLASVILAEVSWLVARHVGANEGLGGVVRLLVASAAGLVAYVAVLHVTRAPELDQFRRRLRPAAKPAVDG